MKIKMAPLIGFVVKLPSNVWNENAEASDKQYVQKNAIKNSVCFFSLKMVFVR